MYDPSEPLILTRPSADYKLCNFLSLPINLSILGSNIGTCMTI
jgi:hypothetical protein